MRTQIAVLIVVVASLCETRAQDANALAQKYAVQATDIARQALLSQLVKHPERVHRISITFSFQIDARGLPHNVKILSKTHNPWAADTARRALSAARFPAIPKKVFQAFGTDLVNIKADFDADASR